MTPAFGFSIGDFISAIELCRKIAKALQDTDGASSEYQSVVIELHGLQNALSRLAALEPTQSNLNHVNAIRGMALACRVPLQEFLGKLNKYDASLGAMSKLPSIKAVARKAKWAIYMEAELKKIRAMVAAKMQCINILLSIHTSESLSRLEPDMERRYHKLLNASAGHRIHLDRVRNKVEEINDNVVSSREAILLESKGISSRADAKLDEISNSTMHGKAQTERLIVEVSAVRSDVRTMSSAMSEAATSVMRVRDMGEQLVSFLRTFPAELRNMLHNIFKTNLQMYYMLLHINDKIGASPTLLLQSNIHFEDALGVVRELPFEWFNRWETFEGLLRSEFKDAPGRSKVLAGEYCIVPARRPNTVIAQNDWHRMIQPGSRVVMLMMIMEFTHSQAQCPRPSCRGVPRSDESSCGVLTCPECNIKYYPQAFLGDDGQYVPDLETAIAEQVIEDLELFGDRGLPPDLDEPVILHKGMPQSPRQQKVTSAATNTDTVPPTLTNLPSQSTIDHIEGPCEPSTPLLTWLENTEPPKNPEIVYAQRLRKEQHRDEIRKREKEEIEMYRNVRFAISINDSDEPVSITQNATRNEESVEFGARIYYRNIVDRYPLIEHFLAKRLAEANLERAERLAKSRTACSELQDVLKIVDMDNYRVMLRQPGSSPKASSSPLEAERLDLYGISPYPKNLDGAKPAIDNWNMRPELPLSESLAVEPPRWVDEPETGHEMVEYWTKGPRISRPASRHSSMNSSLHGYAMFDAGEQDLYPVTVPRRKDSYNSGNSGNSVSDASYTSFALPPPPFSLDRTKDLKKRPFKCDICGQTVYIARKNEWKKHVFADLMPFMCTFPSCYSPNKPYRTSRALIKHQMLAHNQSPGFYHCTHHSCNATLLDPPSVKAHQELHHNSDFLGLQQLRVIASKASHGLPCDSCNALKRSTSECGIRTGSLPCQPCKESGKVCGFERLQLEQPLEAPLEFVDLVSSKCPFCQESILPGKVPLQRHFGRHLEEIAFAVITKPYEEWKLYDDSSSDGNSAYSPLVNPAVHPELLANTSFGFMELHNSERPPEDGQDPSTPRSEYSRARGIPDWLLIPPKVDIGLALSSRRSSIAPSSSPRLSRFERYDDGNSLVPPARSRSRSLPRLGPETFDPFLSPKMTPRRRPSLSELSVDLKSYNWFNSSQVTSPPAPPKLVQRHPGTFQCNLCPKRFTRAYNLRSHLKTHT